MNFRNFFTELKRRNVYKVAIAYGVVAWLLTQIATQIFPFNFTKAADENNAENLLVISDAAVAAEYEQNWQAHFK
jgi:hypothetical protein